MNYYVNGKLIGDINQQFLSCINVSNKYKIEGNKVYLACQEVDLGYHVHIVFSTYEKANKYCNDNNRILREKYAEWLSTQKREIDTNDEYILNHETFFVVEMQIE